MFKILNKDNLRVLADRQMRYITENDYGGIDTSVIDLNNLYNIYDLDNVDVNVMFNGVLYTCKPILIESDSDDTSIKRTVDLYIGNPGIFDAIDRLKNTGEPFCMHQRIHDRGEGEEIINNLSFFTDTVGSYEIMMFTHDSDVNKFKMYTTGNKLLVEGLLEEGTKVYFFSETYKIPLSNNVYMYEGYPVVDVPDVLFTKLENIKVQIDENDYYQTFEMIRANKPEEFDLPKRANDFDDRDVLCFKGERNEGFEELYINDEHIDCEMVAYKDDNGFIDMIECIGLFGNYKRIKNIVKKCGVVHREDEYDKFIHNIINYAESKRSDVSCQIIINYDSEHCLRISLMESYPD